MLTQIIKKISWKILLKAAYKAETINTEEYLNTNYKEDQLVNTVKSSI